MSVMELLKFELRKIFFRQSIYLALAVLLSIYFIAAWDSYSRTGINWREARDLYRKWEGLLTPEKVEAVEAQRNKSRYMALLAADMTAAWENHYFRTYFREGLAGKIAEAGPGVSHGYNYRKDRLTYEMLGRTGPPVFCYHKGWAEIIGFINIFGVYFAGGLILMLLAPVFSEEYTTGMDSLILSSRHGREKVVTAKVAASLITVVSFTLFFAAVSVITNAYLYSLDGGGAPVGVLNNAAGQLYCLSYFYHLGLSRYYLLQLATHICAAAAFALPVLLISVFSRNPLLAFFGGAVVIGAPALLADRIGLWGLLAHFSYTQFLKVDHLYNIVFFNILGHPALYFRLMFIVMFLLSGAALWGIYRGFRTRQVCQ